MLISQDAIVRKAISRTIGEIWCFSVQLVSGRLRLFTIFVPFAGSSNFGKQPVLKPIWRWKRFEQGTHISVEARVFVTQCGRNITMLTWRNDARRAGKAASSASVNVSISPLSPLTLQENLKGRRALLGHGI